MITTKQGNRVDNWLWIIIGSLTVYGLWTGAAAQSDNSHAVKQPLQNTSDFVSLNQSIADAIPTDVRFIDAWARAEGADEKCFNPLNTTLDYGINTSINSVNVRCYADDQTGLEATIKTINQDNFSEVVTELRKNDAEGFVRALGSSEWGTDANTVQTLLAAEHSNNISVAPISSQTSPRAYSNPVTVCRYNIEAALNANNGALRNVTINSGQLFSFNESMGDISNIDYDSCGGSIPGIGWCNLAAGYAKVAGDLGLTPLFQDHGIGDIGQGPEYSVMIWNDGSDNGDLKFTNTLNRPVHLWAEDDGVNVVIKGEIE